ncbi:DEAD/DEAH box helicase family protein, partial [Dolichospermum sp. ST_sed1]|nr:DEAD/DEAH box helicase family protein [Dolichospermum sp. ST_sed1]
MQVQNISNIRIIFDRGTILIQNLTLSNEHKRSCPIPLVWDHSSKGYRIEAYQWRTFKKYLLNYNYTYTDNLFSHFSRIDLKSNITLREYQNHALASWRAQGGKGIICLPTGSGKTKLALKAMELCNAPTLCLVPTRVLLNQWKKEISSAFEIKCGQLGDARKDLRNITVSTYASAYRHMENIGQIFKFIVIDEAHHFGQSLQDEILLMAAAPFRLGLTATKPQDQVHMQNLEKYIGKVSYELQINDLKGTYLAEFDYRKIFV